MGGVWLEPELVERKLVLAAEDYPEEFHRLQVEKPARGNYR